MTASVREHRLARLRPSLSYDSIGQADLVIEAVFESLDVKREVFTTLDRVLKPGAILATNTSTLDVDAIAGFTRRPSDVLGLHFFSPANVMRLLEVVRGRATSLEVLATALQLGKALRKVAVVSAVCDGFIGNRMLEGYTKQAWYLVEEGATPWQVDRAMESFGMAMGPFRVGDLVGHDVSFAIRQHRRAERPGYRCSTLPDKLCALGRLGQKTGGGWYDYPEGPRRPVPSPAAEELIGSHRAEIGMDAAPDRRWRDRRSPRLRPGERGRADPRRGHRRAVERHRRRLSHGLRLPALARRADVLRRAGGVGRGCWGGFGSLRGNPHGDPGFWTPAPLLERLAEGGGTG